MSIMPPLIAFATSTHAWRPELHCLFKLLTPVVVGKPAARAAALNSVAPPPGARTQPTETSSTSAGSIFDRSRSDLKAPCKRSAPAVSLKPPFPPLVRAVLRAHVTTTSSGCLDKMASRLGARSASLLLRCDVTCERRSLAMLVLARPCLGWCLTYHCHSCPFGWPL